MAPVDPNVFNANVKPVAFFATEITLVLALLTAITRFFFVAHKALPPAGHTRNRQAIEHRHLPVFLTLGLLSLFVATFLKSSWRVASYREWIYDNNVVVPNTLWEAGYTKVLGDPALPLGLWWKDANIPTQYFYSILGSPGSFWGTSQLLAATVVWSIFVGIEGTQYFTILSI
jgi:hypothetical protein